MVLGTRYGITGSSGYSGYSAYSGYSGYSATTGGPGLSGYSGYSGVGTDDHAALDNLDYTSAGHAGFQKELIWEPAYKAYLID